MEMGMEGVYKGARRGIGLGTRDSVLLFRQGESAGEDDGAHIAIRYNIASTLHGNWPEHCWVDGKKKTNDFVDATGRILLDSGSVSRPVAKLSLVGADGRTKLSGRARGYYWTPPDSGQRRAWQGDTGTERPLFECSRLFNQHYWSYCWTMMWYRRLEDGNRTHASQRYGCWLT